MSKLAGRAERYRTKAEEVRVIAESMKDKTSQRMLMTVAQDYLAMADMLDHATELGEAMPDLPDARL
jgi:molecular chaperone GrpE (heat shock protein)